MATTTGFDGTATTIAEAELLDALWADDALVRAEFDAIVAAEWPTGQSISPIRRIPCGHAAGGASRRRLDDLAGPIRGPRRPETVCSARERSPPAGASGTETGRANAEGRARAGTPPRRS